MPFLCCGKTNSPPAAKQTNAEENKNVAVDLDKHVVLTDIKDMFHMFDENKNGLITKDECIDAFKKLKIGIITEEIMYLFMTYDTNGDNQLNYQEFCGMVKELMQTKEFPLREMFKYFDADEDSFITVEEFVSAMQCLGVDMNEQKAKEALASHFSPGTEKVDYDNFIAVMKNYMV